MPSPPPRDQPTAPVAPRPGPPPAHPPAREIASQTRGGIASRSVLALRAQANSLPGLACHLLAGSQARN